MVRVVLPDFEYALLAEIAEDDAIPVEQLASELLAAALLEDPER